MVPTGGVLTHECIRDNSCKKALLTLGVPRTRIQIFTDITVAHVINRMGSKKASIHEVALEIFKIVEALASVIQRLADPKLI